MKSAQWLTRACVCCGLVLGSMSDVRAKVYGNRLGASQLRSIIGDVVAERYSDVQLAAFLTAFSSQPPRLILLELAVLLGILVMNIVGLYRFRHWARVMGAWMTVLSRSPPRDSFRSGSMLWASSS